MSADLTARSLTAVTVIGADVTSILDIGLTLEKLETLGVPVLGYGTDRFPAFYTQWVRRTAAGGRPRRSPT